MKAMKKDPGYFSFISASSNGLQEEVASCNFSVTGLTLLLWHRPVQGGSALVQDQFRILWFLIFFLCTSSPRAGSIL